MNTKFTRDVIDGLFLEIIPVTEQEKVLLNELLRGERKYGKLKKFVELTTDGRLTIKNKALITNAFLLEAYYNLSTITVGVFTVPFYFKEIAGITYVAVYYGCPWCFKIFSYSTTVASVVTDFVSGSGFNRSIRTTQTAGGGTIKILGAATSVAEFIALKMSITPAKNSA